MVVQEVIVGLFLAEVLERVGPEDVAHEALGRRFPEAIDLCRCQSAEKGMGKMPQYKERRGICSRFGGRPEYAIQGSDRHGYTGTACS